MNTIFITVKQTNMYHNWYVTGACFCTGINVNYHYTTGESHSHEQVPVVHVCGKFIQYTSVQSRKDDQKNILSLNPSNFLFLAIQPCHR